MKKLKTILLSRKTYLIIICFLFLYVFIFTKIIKYTSVYDGSENRITGIVTNYRLKSNILTIEIKAKEKIIANYYYEDELPKTKSLIGSKITIIGKMNKPNNNTIPNTFNYKKYLYNKKIYYTFRIKDYSYEKSKNIFYVIKNKMYERINTPNKVNEYLNLFILGNKSYIDSDNYNMYLNNGVVHLFAISGMHVGVFIFLLDKIIRWRKKKLFITSLLWLYAFIVSFPISILRAIVFYTITYLLELLDIKLSSLKILFFTFLMLLLINPFNIYDVGFQYSFITVFSIFYYANKLNGNYFIKLLKISIITFLYTLPITVNLNYEINLLSIFNNLLFIPLVSFIIYPLSLITYLIPSFSYLYKIGIIVMEFLNYIIFKIDIFKIIIPKLSLLAIFIYYFFLLFINNKKKSIGIFILLISLKIITKLDSNFYVYYLDVSQGDSSLLISPYQKDVTMIDTGGLSNNRFYISDNYIKFFKSIGITKIDNLLITHGDYDHMGEAINLVNNFKVEKVIFNCGEYNDLEKELIKVLDKKKIKYYSCIKELNIDKNKLHFLQTKEYDNENDNSSVIYTELSNYKFLFMGDAGVEVEENLLEKYNLQNIDVLKVGHHGSKTSSSKNFINEINPKYSIISVGKNNRYRHPNKEVLDNLDNSKIYRTDIDGSIMFKIKNNKLQIETCSQ